MTRWIQFFEGDNRRLSMTRLLCFMSFPFASYVLIRNPDEGMMGLYLGAYVLGYVGGKWADASVAKVQAAQPEIPEDKL